LKPLEEAGESLSEEIRGPKEMAAKRRKFKQAYSGFERSNSGRDTEIYRYMAEAEESSSNDNVDQAKTDLDHGGIGEIEEMTSEELKDLQSRVNSYIKSTAAYRMRLEGSERIGSLTLRTSSKNSWRSRQRMLSPYY